MSLAEAQLTAFQNDANFINLAEKLKVFCPFEALGIVHYEIRHSNFLAYIFDPNRPHGFGYRCLKILLEIAGINCDVYQVEIYREWQNIDILIVLPESRHVIAIEMKINAGETTDQLERYKNFIEGYYEDWKCKFLYITKAGAAPSHDGWKPIELAELIKKLKEIDKKGSENEGATYMLKAYLAMYERHHMEQNDLIKTAQHLWSEHREVLEFLMQHKCDIMTFLYQNHQDLCIQIQNGCKIKIDIEKSSPNYIRFAFPEWNEFREFNCGEVWKNSKSFIVLEVYWKNSKKQSIEIGFVMGNAENDFTHQLRSQLTENPDKQSKWQRLYKRELSLEIQQNTWHSDPENTLNAVAAQISAFISEHYHIITKAIHEAATAQH